MKYLITGGAGFIGSHLTNFLLELGHNIIILDDLSYGDIENVNNKAEFIFGSVCNLDLCIKATKDVDGVFHMAAFSRSGPSFDSSDICHDSNVLGTLMILKACRLNNVKRIIYSGSSTFYGNKMGKQSEILSGDFLNFYGLTKHVGELYVQQYFKNYGLECNILRYFNVYGPGQPMTGAYALVLGIFLNKYRSGQKIEIHGTGFQRRDFIHVIDVVKANYAAMNSSIVGEIFNIGSGINHSILEIANFFPIEKFYSERRPGDAEETLADISKANILLNWFPEIKLHDGIKQLINL
jgi:nucleoside-diphosphate-sugar epimerase